MSENKKKNNKEKAAKEAPVKAADAKTNKAKANGAEAKKTISEKNLAVIITAGILAVILIATAIFMVVDYAKKDSGFDYLKSDLSKYVEFTSDYKNFTINVDIAKPHDIDVDVAILNMIYNDRDTTARYDGAKVTSAIDITAGDEVYIWYRGYLIGDDGEKIIVPGMSNFGNDSAYALGIGSGGFIPGFELNLIGVNTGDYAKFVKIKSGEINENQIAYVTYTKTKGEAKTDKITESNVRIDFSEDIDAIYGEGFEAKLLALKIGDKIDFVATAGDTVYNYTDLTVNFVTECESNPIVIETYFPYDYQQENLRNETAYFEVYVDGVVVYDTPEFTDEYLEKKIEDEEINVTMEELEALEGETLIDKYRTFATNMMYEIYEEEYKTLVEEQIWLYYNEISKALKYPQVKVDAIYDDYIDDIYNQFVSSGGYIYNSSLGQYKTYETFESYAPVYVGVTSGNWKNYVYSQAQSFVKERMVMFYVLKAENLLPGDAEFKATYDEIVEEYIDEAIAQYLSYYGKTREDYTDEEYEDVVAECRDIVFSNFEDEYFEIRTYYTILAKAAIEWPSIKVVTLDDRRAYPQDK